MIQNHYMSVYAVRIIACGMTKSIYQTIILFNIEEEEILVSFHNTHCYPSYFLAFTLKR